MKNNKIVIFISKVIFFGAIWGIVEASLGYLLHFAPPTISGLIMFPIATFILVKAYKALGSRKALIYIGFIAALVKSIDLLLPGLVGFKTINPMLSIILQSMVVAIAYPALISKKTTKRVLSSISTSISWRALFVLYMLIQFLITKHPTIYITSPMFTLSFVLLSGVIGGVIVAGVIWLERKFEGKTLKAFEIKPIYAVLTLVFALGISYII